MKKILLSLLLTLSFIGLANKVKAKIIIAAQSGQFRAGSTWVGSVVPGGSDIAIIPAGITVTFVVDETTPPNDTNHYDPWDNPVLYIYGTYVELSAQYGGTGNGSAAQRLNAANNTYVLPGGIFEDNNYIGDIFLGGSAIYIYSGGQFELGPNIYAGYKSAIFYYNNNGQGVTSPTPATLPLDGSPVSSLPAFFSGPFQMKSDISANPATINTNTPPAAPPVAITNAATSVIATSAILNGTIYPTSATTTASFDWGTSSTLAGSTNVTATTPASGNVTTGSPSTATAYTLATGLSANSIYYFRAKGVNPTSSTGANISSFVTEVPAASSVASTSFTVNWAAVSGATSYQLDVANDNAFTSILPGYNNLTVSGTSQSVTGLTAGSTYYFRIRVVSSAGTSGNSGIGVQHLDSAPILATGSTLSYTENGLPAAINTAIVVNDIDNTTQASATVSITTNYTSTQDVLSFTNDGFSMGNIAVTSNTSGVLTLTSGSTATLAQWQAALRAVKYFNSSDNPSTSARTVLFTINDGTLNSNTLTSTINVTSVNDAPVLATGGTLSYTENDPATPISPIITVSDADNTTQASATVNITNFAAGQDVLSFTNDGSTMGNIAIGSNTSGVLALTSSGSTATLAQWQSALRAVKYSNSSDNPSTAPRSVAFTINDGALNSNILTVTVNVSAVDDKPLLTTGSTISYTENGVPAAINTAITVSDIDNTTQQSATISIANNFVAGEDVLSFTNDGNTMGNIAIGSYTSGVLTLNSAAGTATLAQWQAALRAVTYFNSSDNPSTSARTVLFTINDGFMNSAIVISTINVTAVDDAPVLAGTNALSYTENGLAAVINSAITVNDADNTTLASATVSITANFANGQDVLSFTNNAATMGNISGSYSAGLLSLSSAGSTATLAQWQAALRSVTYSNNSDNPSTLARTVSFTVNDGSLNSSPVTATVNVASVDDAPILANGGNFVSYTENAGATVVNGNISLSDIDNTTLASATVSISANFASGQDVLSFINNGITMGNITGSYAAGTGILALSSANGVATLAQWQTALRSVTYFNSSDDPSNLNRSVSFTVNDGTLNSNAMPPSIISVAPVDDAPVLTGTGTANYTQAGAAATVAPAITVADVDNTSLASATITISGGFLTGDLLAANTAGTSITATYDAGTGVLTLSGPETIANYQQVLQTVSYSSISQNPTNSGADNSRTISFAVNDGPLNSNTVTANVNIIYQPTVITATTLNVNYIPGPAAISVAPDATITAGSAPILFVKITGAQPGDVLDMPAAGSLTAAYNPILGLMISGTGTAAQYEAALRTVTFQTNSTTGGQRALTVSILDQNGVTSALVNLANVNVIDVVLTTSAATTITATTATLGYSLNNPYGVPISDQGVVYSSTNTTPTIADTKAAFPAGTAMVTGLLSNSIYYAAAYATNANGISVYGQVITFTTPYQPPAITATALNVNDTTGSAAIAIAPDASVTTGSAPILLVKITGTAAGDVLDMPAAGGLTAAYNPVLGLTISGTGTAAQYEAALHTVTFQTNSTTAGQRALTVSILDQNGITSIPVNLANINVLTPPTVTTSAVTDITTISATVGDNLTSTGGLTVTDEGVVYSATNTIPTLSDTKVSLGTNESSPGPFNGTAAGLSPNTTYYVAAYATNPAGTSYGSPVSFTTAPPSTDASLAGLSTTPGTISPAFATGTTAYADTVGNSVTTIIITAVTNDQFATGTILTNGNQLSSSLTTNVPVNPGNNNIVITVTAQDGVTQSVYNLSLFRQPGLPVLTTSAVSNISSGSAFFGYQVTSTDGAVLTGQGIVYSATDTNPTTADTKVAFGSGKGTFAKFVTGLQAGTSYYAAAYATNSVGTAYGSTVSFTTLNTINSITAASSNLSNAASVDYTVTFAGSVTGLSAANFTVTGTVSGASVTSVNGSGAVYTVSVNTGAGDGTLVLNLDNAAGLSPGFATVLPFAGDTYTIDKTAPTATISAPSITTIGNNGIGSVSYTITYADANFNTSNLTAAGITLNTPTGTATGNVNVSGSGTSYTVTISNISGTGTLGISLAGGYASDLAGNTDAGAGPSATFNVLSSDAALSNLALSNGALSPGFNSTVTSYKATVGNGLANINITPTVHDPNATLTINGTTATSASATAVPLVVGANNIAIIVTAPDGSTQQTYNLTVTEVQSANDNLASIKTDAGLAQGVTVPSTLTETVVNAVTSITVTPVAADAGASITVNNNAIGGRNPSSVNIPLNQGANTITIVVTAANGAAKTYTLTVTRALEANNKLSGLVVSNGTLSPAFGSATNYNDYVGNGAQLTITPTTADPAATMTVNGNPATSGTPTAVPLVIGNNTVTIIVTAQNGSTKTYTVVVNEARSLNNNLFSLRTSGGLAKGKTVPVSLTETVVPAVSSITVTPTVDDATATVTVSNVAVASGTASVSQPLQMGPNTINIVVTAQNGSIKTYTLTVNRGNAATTDNTVYQPVGVEKPIEQVQLPDDGINVHQGVSPNGDGINDFLQIDNISQYPDNKLSIVNRNGRLIFEAKGYDNTTKTFDGHSNKTGQMQLPGTYFYELEYTVKGENKRKTGYIILKY